MTRPPSEPRPLKDGLDAVLRSLRAGDTTTVRGVFGGWADAVGEMIASNVTPMKLDSGVLTVEVRQPAWATQVRFMERDLMEQLRLATGVTVTAIEVRVTGSQKSRRRR